MQSIPGNVPAGASARGRRWSLAALLAALVVAASVLGSASGASCALTMLFNPSGFSGTVWLQLQDPFHGAANKFQGTYANGTKSFNFSDGSGGTTLMSAPVKLSDIGSGGVNITFSQSVAFYFFYEDPSANSRTAAPSFPTSPQRFNNFELTMMGGAGDQCNLTAINYFGSTMGLRTYVNNPITNPTQAYLQKTGFGNYTTAQIAAQFAALTSGNAAAVVKDAKGKVVRYLGPGNYDSAHQNPWPSFVTYTKSVNAAGQTTHLVRTNGFNFSDGTPVYQFGLDMTATCNADGSISVTGGITASTNTAIKSGNPALPSGGSWSGATVTLSVANENNFNNAIYGQIWNDATTKSGTDQYSNSPWDDFKTFCQTTLKNPTQSHDPTTNPSLEDLGAYDTTVAMIIGEITEGLLGGYWNSAYMVNGTAIKDMTSAQWWALNPLVGFSQIQSQPYYNTYANVIFIDSGNTVYGVPYSDRFGQGPLVNTVNYNGNAVGYLMVDIGAPITSPPATGKALPAAIKLLLLGN